MAAKYERNSSLKYQSKLERLQSCVDHDFFFHRSLLKFTQPQRSQDTEQTGPNLLRKVYPSNNDRSLFDTPDLNGFKQHTTPEPDDSSDSPTGFNIHFRLSDAFRAIERQEALLSRPKMAAYRDHRGSGRGDQKRPASKVGLYYDILEQRWIPTKKTRCMHGDPRTHEKYMTKTASKCSQLPRLRPGTSPATKYPNHRISTFTKSAELPPCATQTEDLLLRHPSHPQNKSCNHSYLGTGFELTRLSGSTESTSGVRAQDMDSCRISSANCAFVDDDDDRDNSTRAAAIIIPQGSSKLLSLYKNYDNVPLQILQKGACERPDCVHDNEAEVTASDECFYLYRLSHCTALQDTRRLLQGGDRVYAGTIDIDVHGRWSDVTTPADCYFCVTAPRKQIARWLDSLDTGKIKGVYNTKKSKRMRQITRAT